MYKLKTILLNGIGDQISITSMPENIFTYTGRKCVITESKLWPFKYNPYVVFMDESLCTDFDEVLLVPDCRNISQVKKYVETYQCNVQYSQTHYMCTALGINNPTLRHSRLYIYEDEDIDPTKIVVHTTGGNRSQYGEEEIRTSTGEDHLRIMTSEIMTTILKNYADYKIVQIGGATDIPLGGNSIDLRGKLDYWGVAKEIASASRFIGVNSGCMHIANCYPRVSKRIVLSEFRETALTTFMPGDVRNWNFSWIDVGNTFFNRFNKDIGFTYSYQKI